MKLRACVIGLALAAVGSACGSGGVGGGEEVRVTGIAEVECDGWEDLEAAIGLDSGEKRDATGGIAVAILDARGTVVGSATLGDQRPVEYDDGPSSMFCEMPFATDVPHSDFYGIRISDMEWTGIPAEKLAEGPVSLYGFYTTSDGPTFRFADDA